MTGKKIFKGALILALAASAADFSIASAQLIASAQASPPSPSAASAPASPPPAASASAPSSSAASASPPSPSAASAPDPAILTGPIHTSSASVPPTPPAAGSDGQVSRPVDSLFESEDGRALPQSQLNVLIRVPHNRHPLDAFTAYPYPVKPPRLDAPPVNLPVDRVPLKGMLLSSGYSNRISTDKAYPLGGWRWQYAFNAGLKKSRLGVPHTILTMYQWIDSITPYVAAECKKWNEIEDARYARYQKAMDEFEHKYADIENEAVRQGLFPVEMRVVKPGSASAVLPSGSWWLTATRKVPGLTYYWQIPVTVGRKESVNLTLSEENALEIRGGW